MIVINLFKKPDLVKTLFGKTKKNQKTVNQKEKFWPGAGWSRARDPWRRVGSSWIGSEAPLATEIPIEWTTMRCRPRLLILRVAAAWEDSGFNKTSNSEFTETTKESEHLSIRESR